MRQKVEYSPNLPTIIEIDGPGTEQANGRGEPEFRYMLEGDRITWVPPTVHDAIVASGADTPGSVFRITKHQAKARAPITWQVEQVEPARGNGYSSSPSPTRPPMAPLTAGHENRPGPLAQPDPHAHRAGAHTQPQPAARLAADAPELPTTTADRMAQALRDSIELWRGVSAMEPNLRWDAADVRCLAATLFIGGGK